MPVQEYRRERERDMMPSLGGSPFIASDPMPSLTGVKDEYNPLRPNDYEEMMKKRKEQKSKEREEDEGRRDREPPTPRDDRWGVGMVVMVAMVLMQAFSQVVLAQRHRCALNFQSVLP